jgi:undecaprenyl phosphate-alpha-L-ara4N flippase subunit ArnE
MLINIAALLAYAIAISIGNLLFNQAAIELQAEPIGRGIVLAFSQPAFYFAALLFLMAMVLWVWILSRVTLSLAYPFLALPIIIVPALASYFFGDVQTARYWLGAALVAVGVVVTQV